MVCLGLAGSEIFFIWYTGDSSNYDSGDEKEEDDDNESNYIGQQCENCEQTESQTLIRQYGHTNYSDDLIQTQKLIVKSTWNNPSMHCISLGEEWK